MRNPVIGVLPAPLTLTGKVTHARIQQDGDVYARIEVGTNSQVGVWVRACTLRLTTSEGAVIQGTVPGLTITGSGQDEPLRGTLVRTASPVPAAHATGFSREVVTSCLASTDKSAVISPGPNGAVPRVSVQG
jgi:hypothetical protein